MICVDCGRTFAPRSGMQAEMELCDDCYFADADLDDLYPEDHDDDYLRSLGKWLTSGQDGPYPI